MLRDLTVGTQQYDGGNLVTQLLQSSNPSLVFDKASPEAYAGEADYALRNTRSYTDSAINMGATIETGTYSMFAGYTGLTAGANASLDLANYSLQSNGGIVGLQAKFNNRIRAGFFGAFDSGSVNSTFLHSTVLGSAWGLFGEYAITSNRSFVAIGTLSGGVYSTDGSRTTNTSTSNFSGMNSSDIEGTLALQYLLLHGKNYSISPEFKLAYNAARVDGVTEKNSVASEALKVNSISADSFTTELAVNGDWALTSKFNLRGRLGVYHDFEPAYRDVTAHLVTESTNFTVRAPGMGQTEVNFSVGASYNFTKQFSVGVSYKGGYNPDSSFSNTYSANLGYSF